MADIFISYSSEDREFADKIAQDLKKNGYNTFYDKEILPGEEWENRLNHELQKAKNLIVILSPNYTRSQWTQQELEAAALSESKGQIKIIPILIEDTEIPLFLKSKLYADFRHDYSDALNTVIKALSIKGIHSDSSKRGIIQITRWLSGVTISALASALGSILINVAAISDIFNFKSEVLLLVGAIVGGIFFLIWGIFLYRSRKYSATHEVLTRNIQSAYITALEKSILNPFIRTEKLNG